MASNNAREDQWNRTPEDNRVVTAIRHNINPSSAVVSTINNRKIETFVNYKETLFKNFF
jgi:hypothetical protein